MRRREFLAATAGILALPATSSVATRGERHLLYVATPGIGNDLEYGGIGVLVFDVANAYRFVSRIPTWEVQFAEGAEPVKGLAVNSTTGRIYVTTIKRIGCLDIVTEQMVWERTLELGCDRLGISPDGRMLYVPSYMGPHWNVLSAETGELITTVVTNSGSHNTVFGRDGTRVYLAGTGSPLLTVVDVKTRTVAKTVGPFSHVIRPFTINGTQTQCYVNVNELLGFEIGDLVTGRMLHRVEIQGFKRGPVKHHGCPSHGIGLTPSEDELWVCDGHNSALHVFDNTVMPPKQIDTVHLRDQPGWISFSIDGSHAYSSTGEIFETRSRKPVAALEDETGRQVGSEKLLEIVFDGDRSVRAGDQFGVGMKR